MAVVWASECSSFLDPSSFPLTLSSNPLVLGQCVGRFAREDGMDGASRRRGLWTSP